MSIGFSLLVFAVMFGAIGWLLSLDDKKVKIPDPIYYGLLGLLIGALLLAGRGILR